MKWVIRGLLCAALAGQVSAALSQSQPPGADDQAADRAVLTIGSRQWSAEAFGALQRAGGVKTELKPEELRTFVDQVAERYALARQAEVVGLPADPRVAQRLALARDLVLADEERKRLFDAAPIDAAAVRADFDAHPEALDELRLSQILVRVTEGDPAVANAKPRTLAQALALATSIEQQLKRGILFSTLARKYSDDEASSNLGGELPVMFAKDLKPALKPAVLALKPNEWSAPVRDADGYHVILLHERAVARFDDVKGMLDFNLREAWANEQLQKLRAATPVSFDSAAWLSRQDRTLRQP